MPPEVGRAELKGHLNRGVDRVFEIGRVIRGRSFPSRKFTRYAPERTWRRVSPSLTDQGLSSTTRKRSFVTIAAMSSPMN